MFPRSLCRAFLLLLFGVPIYLLVEGANQLLAEPGLLFRLQDFKGGSWIGYRLGFAGAVMLLAAQIHLLRPTILSRYEWINVHCYLTLAGGVLILVHSGFPYSFTYVNPLAHIYLGRGLYGLAGVKGVAAWLTVGLMLSGVCGRYLHKRVSQRRYSLLFRRWYPIHAACFGALYVTGVIHLITAIFLKHMPAI